MYLSASWQLPVVVLAEEGAGLVEEEAKA